MIEAEQTADKSLILAIREAVSLYLFENHREKDMAKIAECFLSVDSYHGDRVPILAVIKEVNSLCTVLQDNYLGLKLNFLINLKNLPFYKSVDDCLKPFLSLNNELPFLLVSRIVYRFFFLITQSIELRLTKEKGLLRFDFISNAPDVMNKNQIDGALVLVYRIIEAFCPDSLVKMYVAHRHTSHELEYYESLFGVVARSDKKTSLVYQLECKEHYKKATGLLIKSEQELGRRFFINPLYNMLSTQFLEFSYRHRCEIMMDTMMGVIAPTRINVADAMNISVSTLQRRLDEEGTSFQAVLEETRKRLVKIYLTEKNLSTIDIAYLLGYKSQSQFFKAFKTWYGITPKVYQLKILNGIDSNT